MPKGTAGFEGPLVGRGVELETLRTIRAAPTLTSAVISGPAGVGKSRLAQAALDEAGDEGWATLSIRGGAGFTSVPLGPLRTALGIAPGSGGMADMAASVERELLERRAGKGLLMLVDDGPDLDESTAALIAQLVAGGAIATIVTARSEQQLPVPLMGLWKDGFAERISLQNLSQDETADLLEAILGDHVQDSSVTRFWQVTEGNPLYLREVVLSSLETGALACLAGEWRWQGEWASGDRLQEIVAARLGRLEPGESTAMEMLALTRSLPLDLVVQVTTAEAVEELERRGLVTTERSGRRLEVTIGHPLHAEVLRSQLPALRQRAIRSNLVAALLATGARRVEDLVRIACWSIESGLDVDPLTLSLGSDASLFGIGHAIAGRIEEVIGDAAPAGATKGQAVRQDHQLAVRLARAAYERSHGLSEGAALVAALGWIGDIEGAEVVLNDLAASAESLDDRLRLAIEVGWLRFWGRFDAEGATTFVTAALAEAGEEGDPATRAALYEQLAGIALNTARPAEALDLAQKGADILGLEMGDTPMATPATAALFFLGRNTEAIALADRAVPVALEEGHPLAVAMLLFSKAGALGHLGDIEESRNLGTWLREVALRDELLDATAAFGVRLGETILRQGLPVSAGRIFRDSAGLLGQSDILGYRSWALSGVARCMAQTGQTDGARAALEEARLIKPIERHYDPSLHMAEVEIHVASGAIEEAERAASRAADWAHDKGMPFYEAVALDAQVRIRLTEAAVQRLADLTHETDSKLVTAWSDHASALLGRDPAALLEVAERFATMTAWWMAAEAASAAATILDRRGQPRAAKAALRTALDNADRCERPVAPLLDAVATPTRLTKRERQIALLAAAGDSNKEIAAKMQLSTRTVENHLYRVFTKLGVRERAALSGALGESAGA